MDLNKFVKDVVKNKSEYIGKVYHRNEWYLIKYQTLNYYYGARQFKDEIIGIPKYKHKLEKYDD